MSVSSRRALAFIQVPVTSSSTRCRERFGRSRAPEPKSKIVVAAPSSLVGLDCSNFWATQQWLAKNPDTTRTSIRASRRGKGRHSTRSLRGKKQGTVPASLSWHTVEISSVMFTELRARSDLVSLVDAPIK
jgi:hypothetical protein